MAKEILTKILVVSVMLNLFTFAKTGCPTNILNIQGVLHYHSKDQVDSNVAEERCSSMGGELATIKTANTLNKFKDYLARTYHVSDLQTVWVYTVGLNFQYTRTPTHKFGEKYKPFPSFQAYKSLRGDYIKPIVFCKASTFAVSAYTKWEVKTYDCDPNQGWQHDFVVYGGLEGAPRTKPVYGFISGQDSTELSLVNKEVSSFKSGLTIYIPDFNVYIGIRSDVNQAQWYFGHEVTFSYPGALPATTKSICQQIALHYNGTNWKPTAVECGTQPADYLCELKFAVNLESTKCNSRSLRLSWNPDLYQTILPSETNPLVSVDVNGSSYKTFLSKKNLTIPNLTPRTSYIITAKVFSSQCPTVVMSTTVKAKTGDEIPEKMVDAFVYDSNNSLTNQCRIKWKHKCSDNNIDRFKILANSNISSTTITFNAFHTCNNKSNSRTANFVIPDNVGNIYGFHTPIKFQIISDKCEGTRKYTPVAGSCTFSPAAIEESHASPARTPTLTVVAVILPVVGIAILLIVAIFFYKRRSNGLNIAEMARRRENIYG